MHSPQSGAQSHDASSTRLRPPPPSSGSSARAPCSIHRCGGSRRPRERRLDGSSSSSRRGRRRARSSSSSLPSLPSLPLPSLRRPRRPRSSRVRSVAPADVDDALNASSDIRVACCSVCVPRLA
eukprot:5115698-Prymnesium_polylepis.2